MSYWDKLKNSPVNPMYMWERDDPEKNANKYLDQIPGVGHKYNDSYMDRGRGAGDRLGSEYERMLDPSSFMDDIMSKYKMSKGAEYQRDQLGRGIGATAAAGGFAGTPEHQQEYGEMANSIMSKDMQQYFQNALGIYGGGISGEQDFYNKGFDASGRQQELEGGTLASQGGLAFKSADNRNADRGALMNAIIKAISQRPEQNR